MAELSGVNLEREEDFEVPKQIIENFSAEERILFKLRTQSTPEYLKYFNYIIPIMLFVLIIEIIVVYVRKGSSLLFSVMIFPILIMAAIGIIVYWTILKKKKFGTTESRLFISNVKLYLFQKFGKIEKTESIDLSSIKAITITHQKIQRDFSDKGYIEFISDMVKRYEMMRYSKMYRIKIRNVPNIFKNYQIMESILWQYGRVNERLDQIRKIRGTKEPYEFQCSREIYNKLTRFQKIYNIINGIAIIIFIIGIIMLFMEGRIMFAIGSLLFSTGIAVVFTNIIANWQKRKGVPRKNYILQLYHDKIALLHDFIHINFGFNANMFFDVVIVQIVLKGWKYTDFGTILFRTTEKSSKKLKIGPLKDFLEVLEVIYLTFLNWKAERKMVLSPSRIFDSKRGLISEKEKVTKQHGIQEFGKEKRLRDFREINLDTCGLPEEIKYQFQKYLNEGEKVYLVFKPIISNKKIIIYTLLVFLGIISFGLFIWVYFSNIFESFPTFLLLIIGTSFGCIFACIGPIGIFTELVGRKIYYMFSDQKIMGKYGKKYFAMPYSNVSLILREEKKHSDIITLDLKTPIKESPYMDQNRIIISNVPKESKIYEMIKYLRENAIKSED